MSRMVKKRCTKCGNISVVSVRERRCKQLEQLNWKPGKRTKRYWCYGQLVPTIRKERKLTPLEQAEKNAYHYEALVARKESQIKRLTNSIKKFGKKVRYYQKRADELRIEQQKLEHEQQLSREGRFKTIVVKNITMSRGR